MNNLVDYIKSDCSIVLPNGELLDSHEIHTYKNFYKRELYTKLQGKTVGKVALIWSNNLDVILPAVKAMWELGIAISVHDFNVDVVTHPLFANFYKHIDIIIGSPDADSVLPYIPHINALETKMDYPAYTSEKAQKEIFQLTATDCPDIEFQLDSVISGDTVCCVTHTSGTTGEPKIVKTTHRTAINLVKENIKLFEFNSQDIVIHHKTLHHGSLFLNYAIPAFVMTNRHHWVLQKNNERDSEFLERCLVKCQRDQITKWLLAYKLISKLSNQSFNESYNLYTTSLITVVGPEQKEMQSLFDKYNPMAVYNNFGCTEIGTLVVSKTQASTVNDYYPNKFTKFNSLIDFEIFPTFFKAKFKGTEDWQTIGDIVNITDGTFLWEGRNTFLVAGQQKINIFAIERWTKDYLNTTSFSVVPDFEANLLYLAIFDTTLNTIQLEEINQALKKSDILKNCAFSKLEFIEYTTVAMGVKPSQPVLLYYFRGKI